MHQWQIAKKNNLTLNHIDESDEYANLVTARVIGQFEIQWNSSIDTM